MTNQATQSAATTERALWSLAHRINPSLAAELLKKGASVEQALTAIEGVASHSPQPQQQANPQPQPGGQQQWDAMMQGNLSGDGTVPAFSSGFLGDSFAAQMAEGERVAKAILAKVELTR
jgi:hypothetical protein